MNEFAKWKMGLAMWFGTIMFVFLVIVVLLSNISSDAKVAIAMAVAAAFTSIIYAYWRKTSAEEKINPSTSNGSGAPASKIEPPKAPSGQVDLSKTVFGNIAKKLADDTVSAVEEQMAEGYEAMAKDPWASSGGNPVKPPTVARPNEIIMQVGVLQFVLDVEGKTNFEPVLFMDDVKADCLAQDKDRTSPKASLAYDARAEIEGNAAPWQFTNVGALKDAVNFVFGLYQDAFIEKFGVGYQTAIANFDAFKNSGCTTCAKVKGCTHPTFEEETIAAGIHYERMLREYRQMQFAANFIQ